MKEKVKGLFKRLRQARGPKKPRKMSRKKKLLTAAAGLILFLALITAAVRQNKASAVKAQSQRVNTATVIRQNITSTLSSSGTISPKDTYSITSMSEGEVVQADFEEGDRVEAGQILYRIDASSMESKLSSASNSLERAQSSYDTAVSDYNENQSAVFKYGGGGHCSRQSGSPYLKRHAGTAEWHGPERKLDG